MHRAVLGTQTRPMPACVVLPLAPRRPAFPTPLRLAGHRRRTLAPVRASAGPSGGPNSKPSSGWRAFWATVDAGAWLGTVGTAVAFLLTQEALLVGGPIVLPLIALYASRQRGRLDSQAAAAELQGQVAAALRQVAALSEEAAADVAEEVAALVDEVRAGRSSPEKAVRGLESKLAEVEGSVRSTGEATSAALAEAAVQRGRAVKEISSSLGALRRELSAEIREATGDEVAALGRLDARLAALEGAVSGLEVAQSEGLRRLGSSMNGALSESRKALAAAVRDEVWSSLDPVRQLPAALAAAAPGLAAAAGANAPDEATLRSLVAEEVSAAAERLIDAQREMLQEAMAAPATVAPAQWNQLGKRLVALDSQLAALKEEQRDRIASLAGAMASDGDGAAEAVAALRAEIADLSSSVTTALESQAAVQRAALEAAGRPGAAALELLLAPLDTALTELKQELAEIESDAMDDSERRLQGLVDRVLEAIATARATAATAPAGAENATESQTAALQQAVDSIAAVSGKLEGLGAQLEALESRLAAAPAPAATESVASSAASVAGPPAPSVASPVPLTPDQAREEAERAEAYERMQALLRGGSGDEENGKKGGEQATGMPISAWLSRDEEDEAEEESSVSSREATVGAGVGGAAVGPRNILLQEQIAFEASLAAAETIGEEEEEPEVAGSGGGVANGAASAAEAPGTSYEMNGSGEEYDEAGQEAMSAAAPEATAGQQEPVDAEALYSQGLELLRRGRAAATDSPNSWEVLEDADVTLGDATACFQAAAGAASRATAVKALGNSGNALMARARVKRQLAEVLVAADGGAASPESEALLAEARELLVVAGRRYREVLQADGSQGRAFLNWGRAVCLRAELAREAGDGPGARALFENAAEKFQAALQLDAEPAEALRLAGSALASAAAECEDPGERGRLLEDAEALLTEAVEAGAGVEAEARLDECRAALGW